jgi:mono/diheme cytochrome c family protein
MKPHLLPTMSVLLFTALALASIGVPAPASEQTKPPRQDYTSGPYLYRVFCASCHGETGVGNGPVSDLLRVPPFDLTAIAKRNAGAFPGDQVFAIIDGRTPVPGLGRQDMPVWGDVLRVTEGHDQATIRKRIDALVKHLESIQR